MARARLILLVLLTVLPLSACATTVGTVAGPVTGPMTYLKHTWGAPTWVQVVLSPFMIPVGPFVGFYAGARADVGYVRHGEYGVYPGPPFEIVWDPTNRELDSPPMDKSYGEDERMDEFVKRGSNAR